MKQIFLIILVVYLAGCRDKYILDNESTTTGYLVVEGNINNGSAPTVINLSRTSTLGAASLPYEKNATVTVEGNDNSISVLHNDTLGTYSISSLNLNKNNLYRLHIKTKAGDEYLSDFVSIKETPPIDSISWKNDNTGLTLFVNAYDPTKNTLYYQWDYSETWEFHSAYSLVLQYKFASPSASPRTVEYIDSSTFGPLLDRFYCWKTQYSNRLLLGSTTKLSEDRVYLPINLVPAGSQQLSILYSINVRQYALSKDAYEYLEKMRKNTETTGSIFDPQPSALKGNIHAVKDPDETVIGFVNISSLQEKRKFIYNREVPGWWYTSGCEENEVQNIPDSVSLASSLGYVATYPSTILNSQILSFFTTPDRKCVDCTLTGSNKKPAFWP